MKTAGNVTIDDLPDEVIEFVLSFVSPYNDLHTCMQVCQRWKNNVMNVVRQKRRDLDASLLNFNMEWQEVVCSEETNKKTPTISKRYSHCATVLGDNMYVFGGCTANMTTFNDLWCLNLNEKRWSRPLAKGSFPAPKACSSLVVHKQRLLLFGGWTYPSVHPFHQSYQLFNELHVFDVPSSRWTCFQGSSGNLPPPTAGHSATVHGNYMVLFGGIQLCSQQGRTVRKNDVWTLHLDSMEWTKQDIAVGPQPSERYGHSQFKIDDQHALIMGGCGSPNGLLNDVWLLKMKGQVWQWQQLPILALENGPSNTWRHHPCKVGQRIVVLQRNRNNNNSSLQISVRPKGQKQQPSNLFADPDNNVNGRRGLLRHQPVDQMPNNIQDVLQPPLRLSAFAISTPPVVNRNREKQLEQLRKLENQFQQKVTTKKHQTKRNTLDMYILDIENALMGENAYVRWLKNDTKAKKTAVTAAKETILYSLVEGKGELIMFGGLQQEDLNSSDTTNEPPNTITVSNSVYVIKPPLNII